MIAIDEIAYNSKISKTNPKIKIAFGIIPLFICIFFNAFSVSILAIFIMGIVTLKYSKITFKKYIFFLLIPFSFLILGTITIIFNRFEQTEQLLIGFSLFGYKYGITQTSLKAGGLLILKALGTVSCMYFVALNTPMNDIIKALQDFKVPNILISLMELIYRYIFVILEETNKIRIAQDSRLGYIDFKTSIKSLGTLIGTLFLRTYLKCDKIYQALVSRGYEGDIKTIKQKYLPSRKILVFGIITSLILIFFGVWERGIF
jgi:cobalt/nickel transport system permease protein